MLNQVPSVGDKFCDRWRMPQYMLSFLKRWLITTVAVWLAASIVPGISFTPPGLVLAALVLGLLNAIVRPVLVVLSLPLLVLTMGLFMLVINAVLLWSVGAVLKDFHVDGFAPAFWGSLIISITSLVLNFLTKNNSGRMEIRVGKSPGRRPPNDDGGPVIDV